AQAKPKTKQSTPTKPTTKQAQQTHPLWHKKHDTLSSSQTTHPPRKTRHKSKPHPEASNEP
ncbi:hypothetical protein, partial [Actinomyces respiraculi]|uniref:hypothetical protein n=1 Tax=Actinomyces respiraculi TaxID=2744574 RepID=UPI001A7E27FB